MFILAQASQPLPVPLMDRFDLPGPWWLFLLLYHVTFVLHFVFMNFVVGGSAACLICDLRSLAGAKREYFADIARKLAKPIPVALSFTITLGVAPLLFVQVLYGQFFYSANVLLGLVWFSLIAVLMAAFYIAHVQGFEVRRAGTGWVVIRLVSTAAMLAGFGFVAFLLTNNAVWSILPQQWLARYQGELGIIAPDAQFWPRLAHNLTGSLAIGCLLCALVARTLRFRLLVDEDWVRRTVRGFLLAALVLTGLQIIDGVTLLSRLAQPTRHTFLFSAGSVHVWGWRVGLACAIGAVLMMIRGVRDPRRPLWPWLATLLALATLSGMSMARQAVRQDYLLRATGFDLSQWPQHTQFAPLLMFIVSFVLALGVIAWMLRVGWKAGPFGSAATTPTPSTTTDPDTTSDLGTLR